MPRRSRTPSIPRRHTARRSRRASSQSSISSNDSRKRTRYDRYYEERTLSPQVRSEVRMVPAATTSATNSTASEGRIKYLETMLQQLLERDTRNQRADFLPPRITVHADCIPEFAPGHPQLSASKWLEKIEQLAELNRWDDITKIYHMQSRLTGIAKSWYENLQSYNHTWDQWKEMIVKTFPEFNDFASTLKKLIFRVKLSNETMTQYYFAKMQLLRACDIKDKNAVSLLIDGLRDTTLQTGARAGRFQTPEALYQEYLSTVNEQPVSTNSRKDTRIYFERNSGNERQIVQEVSGALRCYNCRLRGHISTKCPKPKIECTTCKRLGHTAATCTRKSHHNPGPSS